MSWLALWSAAADSDRRRQLVDLLLLWTDAVRAPPSPFAACIERCVESLFALSPASDADLDMAVRVLRRGMSATSGGAARRLAMRVLRASAGGSAGVDERVASAALIALFASNVDDHHHDDNSDSDGEQPVAARALRTEVVNVLLSACTTTYGLVARRETIDEVCAQLLTRRHVTLTHAHAIVQCARCVPLRTALLYHVVADYRRASTDTSSVPASEVVRAHAAHAALCVAGLQRTAVRLAAMMLNLDAACVGGVPGGVAREFSVVRLCVSSPRHCRVSGATLVATRRAPVCRRLAARRAGDMRGSVICHKSVGLTVKNFGCQRFRRPPPIYTE
jgi:hypothetical protein